MTPGELFWWIVCAFGGVAGGIVVYRFIIDFFSDLFR